MQRRALLPVTVLMGTATAVTWISNIRQGVFGFDFHRGMWVASQHLAHGQPIYPPADPTVLLSQGAPYIWPPPLAVLGVPLTWLPWPAAGIVWTLLNLASLVAALRLVGLRDRRLWLLALLSFPVTSSLLLGQPNGLLVLLAALAWRYRDRALKGGAAVGTAAALKLLALPLLLWFVFTRRWRAAATSLVVALVWLATTWAVIGWSGLRDYPSLLAADARAFQSHSFSLVALATNAHIAPAAGRLACVLAAMALIGLCRITARTDDLTAYGLATLAGIVASPVVHVHYLIALLIPLAASRRRRLWPWLLLVVFWLTPSETATSSTHILLVIATAAAILVASSEDRRVFARAAPATADGA
jgi:alpha-1,2-mannosyltransferase